MAEPVRLSTEPAVIHVRLLPWRPRIRKMDPERVRDAVDGDILDAADFDLAGIVIGVLFVVFVYLAAPVLVILLAVLLLPFEIGLVLIVAAALVLARLAGIVQWVVEIPEAGDRRTEKYRSLLRAARRVRQANGTRRVAVRISRTG